MPLAWIILRFFFRVGGAGYTRVERGRVHGRLHARFSATNPLACRANRAVELSALDGYLEDWALRWRQAARLGEPRPVPDHGGFLANWRRSPEIPEAA